MQKNVSSQRAHRLKQFAEVGRYYWGYTQCKKMLLWE